MSGSRTASILLVEDNPDDVDLALHAFRRNSLATDIAVARDGAEAQDYLFGRGKFEGRNATDTPLLILLDLKLPKVGGLEVLRSIRENPTTRHIPVVIMSTSDEHSDIDQGYKLGANSYVRKPVDFVEFGETIRDMGNYWLKLNTGVRTH